MKRTTSARAIIIALVTLVVTAGVAFAINQFTREVSASVNVLLLPDSGIEIYLDEALTEIAESVDFGVLEVDVFGTVREAASVPVWVKNQSLSRIAVTLRDDFAPADVLFVGPNQQHILDPGEVLPGILTLRFHEVSEGVQAFTVFVDAEGPFDGTSTSGTLTIAVLSVNSPNGLPRFCTAGCAETIYMSGITDVLFNSKLNADGTISIENMISTGFTLDPSLDFGDFTLRQGVQFHNGWGEMTAADVAFSYNDANSVTNPESIHGQAGDFAQLILNMEAIEPHIVRLNYRNFDSRGILHRFSRFWQTAGIVSKDVFEAKGIEGMQDDFTGVGAFVVDEWSQNKGIFLSAFPDYYDRGEGSIGPHVAQIAWLEVPEGASRRAMLETEEAQISQVATKDIPVLV